MMGAQISGRPPQQSCKSDNVMTYAKSGKVGAVEDRAADTLGGYQSGIRQDRQMGGHGVLRHANEPSQFTGGDAIRFLLNQHTESLQP